MTVITIPDEACEYRFVHASGPGGQHVNKASTAVELRVRVNKLGLSDSAYTRLTLQQKNRITKDATLIIQADQFRSQLKNRKDALERLQKMVAQALIQPKIRRATRPSLNAKKKRMNTKKQRGRTKSNRQKPTPDS